MKQVETDSGTEPCIFSVGHMNMLRQAKHALGDPRKTRLIVGVCGDAVTHKEKGLTVMAENIRVESVKHCRWVDEVIPDAPWVITPEFLEKHRIDFVAHDAIPYVSGDHEDVYSGVKRLGKFLTTARTEGISTSDIIVTIVRDYDRYVERNLARGYDKKDLNVGRTWEIRAVAHEKGRKLDEAVAEMKRRGQELSDTAKRFVRDFDRGAFKGRTGDPDADRSKAEARERLSQDLYDVTVHLWGLTAAVVRTGVLVASYLNVFSYIDKCRSHRKKPK